MWRTLGIGIALLGAHLALAGPAAASGGNIKDGRDTKSPLDVASVSYGRIGDGQIVTHTVHFYKPVRSRAFASSRAILGFVLDTDLDGRPDRLAVVVFANRQLRTVVADSRGKILNVSAATRPNSRSVTVKIATPFLGSTGGYRWSVLTMYKDRARCRRSCVDTAPNRTSVLFDYLPPTLDLGVPDPYNAFATTTEFNVHVSVAEKVSGLKRWTLEQRAAGQTEWSTIASGTAIARIDVPRSGSEGATYEFRLTAVDKQGNVSSSTRLVSIPIDDANPLLAAAYGGGSWDAYLAGGNQLFQNTAHRASGIDATFTYSFTGTYFAWLSPLGSGPVARVSVDGGLPREVTVNNNRRPFELSDLANGSHTIKIEPDPLRPGYQIDGIVVR
jgi:hypothetical protein